MRLCAVASFSSKNRSHNFHIDPVPSLQTPNATIYNFTYCTSKYNLRGPRTHHNFPSASRPRILLKRLTTFCPIRRPFRLTRCASMLQVCAHTSSKEIISPKLFYHILLGLFCSQIGEQEQDKLGFPHYKAQWILLKMPYKMPCVLPLSSLHIVPQCLHSSLQ